jgi:hypothetical protein
VFRKLVLALTVLAVTAVQANARVVFIPIYIPASVPVVPAAVKADYEKIHKVAVISAIGGSLDVMSIRQLGPADERPFPISDWNLDAQATALLKQYLGGRFEFHDVAYDSAALSALPNGHWTTASASTAKLVEYLKTLPAGDIDAFLLVRPDQEAGVQAPPGIGIFMQGGDASLWANYEIDIVDAKDIRQIAKSFARVRLRDNTTASFAGLELNKALYPDGDQNLTATQLKTIGVATNYLLRVSMIETIRALDLGVPLPAAGARVLKPIPADSNPYRKYKSIAVASVLGDGLTEDGFGFMQMSHDHFVLPVPDWQLDARAEERVKKALAGHFEVHDADVDRAALSKISIMSNDLKVNRDFSTLKPSGDTDLWLLLMPASLPVVSGHKAEGAGLYKVTGGAAAYVNYLMVLVDARSGAFLMSRLPTTSPDHAEAFAWRRIDKSVFPDKPPALSPAQAEQVKATITSLLDDTLDETVLRMGLTGLVVDNASLPPAAAQTDSTETK